MSLLPGLSVTRLVTARIETRVLSNQTLSRTTGNGHIPLLCLHGNLASATYFEELLADLPREYLAVAIDQRGYGLSDRSALIDATLGFGNWVEDAISLANECGWDRFHLLGHSLGGCVGWGLLARYPERLLSLILVATGPPCGFGGTRGEWGVPIYPDGAGSGAGLVNAQLVEYLSAGRAGDASDPFSPVAVMNRLFWKPPFVPPRLPALLDAMFQVHSGPKGFPGDWVASPYWPGFAPGRYGPINAMAPIYNQWVLPAVFGAVVKPRILWLHGTDDLVICDAPPSDPGTQGKLGLRPDWPGETEFPPQPILSQIRFALREYKRLGGEFEEVELANVAHVPMIETPDVFRAALMRHLSV